MGLGGTLAQMVEALRLGRILRRLGLPLWTFLGIGISTWLFDSLGTLMQQAIAQLMGIADPDQGWQTYIPAGLLFLLTLASIVAISLWQGRRHAATGGRTTELQQTAGKQVLIVLVSNPKSAVFAINYHFLTQGTLEQVWLIPSDDSVVETFGPSTRDRIAIIQHYCQRLMQKTGRSLQVEVHAAGVCPADAQDTFDVVNRIYRRSFYPPEAIIADFTGGTKPMAVGVIMACLPAGRELQYVPFNPVTRQSQGPFLVDYQHSAFDLVG